jgi:zinc protease
MTVPTWLSLSQPGTMMNRRPRNPGIFLFLFVLLSLSRAAHGDRPVTDGLVRTTLPNGLRVLVKPRHTAPVVTTMMWYRVGSRDEVPGATGIAHFLEHLMFKGTAKLKKGEVDRITYRSGGSNNAMTSYDFTAYEFNLPKQYWKRALAIEADRMRNTRFDAAEFEAERNVVMEERRIGEDDPASQLDEQLGTLAFAAHPYRNPIIGWMADLKRLSVGQVRAFYDRYYVPVNAALVIAGDVEPSEAIGAARAAFAAVPAYPPPKRPEVGEPPLQSARRLSMALETEVPRLEILFRLPDRRSADVYAADLLEYLLAEGKLSRLYRRLVDTDLLAAEVSASTDIRRDAGLFAIDANAKEGTPLKEIEAAVWEELDRLREQPVAEPELIRARNQFYAQWVQGLGTAYELAAVLGEADAMGGVDYLATYPARVLAVTAADIQRVAGRYLRRERAAVGYLLPRGQSAVGGRQKALGRRQMAAVLTEPSVEHLGVVLAGGVPSLAGVPAPPGPRSRAGTPFSPEAQCDRRRGCRRVNSRIPMAKSTCVDWARQSTQVDLAMGIRDFQSRRRSPDDPSPATVRRARSGVPTRERGPRERVTPGKSRSAWWAGQGGRFVPTRAPGRAGTPVRLGELIRCTGLAPGSQRCRTRLRKAAPSKPNTQHSTLPPLHPLDRRLPNGLHLVLLEKHDLPSVTISARVDAGAYQDPDDKAGLANLAARMLEEGTESRSHDEIAEALEQVGASFSSTASGGWTTFTLQSLSRHTAGLVPLFAEMLRSPSFPEARLEQEQQRLLVELKEAQDDPETVARHAFNELVYGAHPAHRPVEGTLTTVPAIGTGDLARFHQRYYRPAAVTLVAVGDFRAADLLRRLTSAFGDWEGGEPAETAAPLPAVVRQTERRTRRIMKEKAQVQILLGHLGVPRASRDFVALQVMDAILGEGVSGGFTARIPYQLRDVQGLAYGVGSSITASAGIVPGVFLASLGTEPKNERAALQALLKEVRRIRASGVTPTELRDARQFLAASAVFDYQTNDQLAAYLQTVLLYRLGYDYRRRFPGLVQAVTRAEVLGVARKYLDPEHYSLVVVGPAPRSR